MGRPSKTSRGRVRCSRRQLQRLERSERVCRELRWILTNPNPGPSKLGDLLEAWMRLAPKSKYLRP